MNKLLALADRVEKLTGPDREVDAEIWCELHGVRYQGHHKAYGCEETQVEFTRPPKRTREVSNPPHLPHARAYTASLDAAMTLVPEKWGWQLSQTGVAGAWLISDGQQPITVGGITFPGVTAQVRAEAISPALALTCAALRARAHGGGEG